MVKRSRSSPRRQSLGRRAENEQAIMKLTGNTILITGGASGIGYELTKQLTALGNTILITGRDQAKLDRAKVAFPKIHTFQSDVSDPKAIAALYEKVTKQSRAATTGRAGVAPDFSISPLFPTDPSSGDTDLITQPRLRGLVR